MSSLRKGDDDLHYSDNSHRWIAPPDIEQCVWEADMRNHLSQHKSTMGGPAIEDAPMCRPHAVPRAPQPAPRKVAARRAGTGAVPRPELPKHVKDRSARPLPGAA